jgi:hypothetical protein
MDDSQDFIAFQVDPARDPDGSGFRQVLTAHLAYERARAWRLLLMQVFLVLTVTLGGSWVARGSSADWLDVLLQIAWVISTLTLVCTWCSERLWRARRERCLVQVRTDWGRATGSSTKEVQR